MLFITNRYPKQKIEKDVMLTRFDFDESNNAAANTVFFCERKKKNTHAEIGSLTFFDRLKKSAAQQILLYIHGFSNLPEDVFAATAELQLLFDRQQKKMVQVIPMIWPCDNDLGVIGDYWDDQKAADQSAYSFSRVLQKFMKWRDSGKPAISC